MKLMRRKIIKQGNNSYTLTLPVNWIREEKLELGGEIEINQEDNHLVISLPKDIRRQEKAFEIEIKDYNERTIRNILNQTYRKGYDKILVKIPDKTQLEDIRDITRNTLLGFEVITENGDHCIIQNIAEPSGDNFYAILRKIFFYIEDESKEILEDLTNKKYDLKKRQHNKNIVDNYTNLCRRLVIKDKMGGTKNSYLLFSVISRLSLIHHAYYYLYKFSSQKKLPISKPILDFLKETNEMFALFHKAFYTKDLDKAHQVGMLKDKLLYEDLYNLFQITKGPENILLYHLGEIIRLIHMQSTNMFGLIDLEF